MNIEQLTLEAMRKVCFRTDGCVEEGQAQELGEAFLELLREQAEPVFYVREGDLDMNEPYVCKEKPFSNWTGLYLCPVPRQSDTPIKLVPSELPDKMGLWLDERGQYFTLNTSPFTEDAKQRIGEYLTQELPQVAPDIDWYDGRYMEQLVEGICKVASEQGT